MQRPQGQKRRPRQERNTQQTLFPRRFRKTRVGGDVAKGRTTKVFFIRNAPSNTRSGKTVYIRKEFHERITRIVQVIGQNELSLYSYLDNVLEHHFATYQEDIMELYSKRNVDIF